MRIATAVRCSLGFLLVWVCTWSHALVFAVNEGVSYRVSSAEIAARYAEIARDLTKILGEPVTIEPVGPYPQLRQGLAAQTYDLAMVHPAHLSIVAMRDSGYKLVAVIKGFEKYTANFLIMPDSPLQSLSELKDKKLSAPDEDSITSWMVRATLRDALNQDNNVKLLHTRYQDAVPFMVENKFTIAGATAANSVIKEWQAKGGKVLAKSKPVPIKHIIASPHLSIEQVDKVRHYLLGLDSSEAGKKKLQPTKYAGFALYDQEEMMAVGRWLGL
jgi:phosphonate transport system substrate-binding protein